MIKVDKVYFSINDVEIIKDISLNVLKGQFTGIIGPNGSGKSTLLKNIYKILKPNSGKILLDDDDVVIMSNREAARRLSVVAQENSTQFDFSVLEVVLMSRYHKKNLTENINETDIEIAKRALNTVELTGFEDRSFLSLSGGEKQRVILARAMAQETNTIILDEPTNHLDIGSQIKTLLLLKKLNKTVLTALHDLSIAARFCDYIFVLFQGEVYAHGYPKEIINQDLIKKVYGVDSEVFVHNERVFIDYL